MEMVSLKHRLQAGIYLIRNEENGKTYVGSSVDILIRTRGHMSLLRNNRHHNPKLQASFAKHGESSFSCYVLELCTPGILLEREQEWIDKLLPWYNITQVVVYEGMRTPYKQEHNQKPVTLWTISGEKYESFSCIADASRFLGKATTAQANRVYSRKERYIGEYVILPLGKPFDRQPLEYAKAPSSRSVPVKHQSGRCFASQSDCAQILGICRKRAKRETVLL